MSAWTAAVVDSINRRRAVPLRLPGFVVPQSLAVRAKPLRYSNARLRATGWAPEVSLEQGLSRSVKVPR
jgi:nucleoside-diphosphate-sugar epimerase